MKKTLAIIEKDENGYGIYTPDLKDTVISGSGMSVEDAKADFLTAYKEVLDSYTENGEAVPDELKDLAFEYKYDVSAFFNQFDCINASKFAALAGISPSLIAPMINAGEIYMKNIRERITVIIPDVTSAIDESAP